MNVQIFHTSPNVPWTGKSPEIGDWYTFCCGLDLKQILDEEDRQLVLESMEDGEPYPVGIWATKEEAERALVVRS